MEQKKFDLPVDWIVGFVKHASNMAADELPPESLIVVGEWEKARDGVVELEGAFTEGERLDGVLHVLAVNCSQCSQEDLALPVPCHWTWSHRKGRLETCYCVVG